ncbi:MAG: glycosyltransferase [Wenzhouxiangellaceae bacterium]|nr:glycosyltransferase [Wenzhouxiangellaceae bacterium]
MSTKSHPTSVPVAFVSDSMPERNGVGAYYRDLIDQLEALDGPRRFETCFVCPGGAARAGVNIPLPGDATQRVYLPSPREFSRLMRSLKPAVIVVATPGPFGLLGMRWARKLSVPLIVGFHTDYAGVTDLYQTSILRMLSRGYFRRIDRLLFRRAEHVLVNTTAMIEQAERLGARRVRRIGTLVPRILLDTPPQPHSGTIHTVLFAGRLAPEKRLGQVLDAAAAMPDLDFVIAGDGPLKAEIVRAAATLDNLDYAGWVNRETLMQHLDAADALVLPSEFESFGNVALEAMARARIAIVTASCGIAHWSRLARHLVVHDGDEALTSVLQRVRGQPSQTLSRQAEQARQAAVALNAASLAEWIELLAAGHVEP